MHKIKALIKFTHLGMHLKFKLSYNSLKLLCGIFEFKITTGKIFCIFLDKHNFETYFTILEGKKK